MKKSQSEQFTHTHSDFVARRETFRTPFLADLRLLCTSWVLIIIEHHIEMAIIRAANKKISLKHIHFPNYSSHP